MVDMNQKGTFVQRLMALLGRPVSSQQMQRYAVDDDDTGPTKQFTTTELSHITRGDGPTTESNLNIKPIMAQLTEVSKSLDRKGALNRAMVQMTPEIQQAARIYTSSILAPNDLQTGAVSIAIDDEIDGLDGATIAKVNQLLTTYFDKTIGLGQRLPEWIRECLFETGSRPIMVLPRKHIQDLMGEGKISADTEVIDVQATLLDDNVYVDELVTSLEDISPEITDSETTKMLTAAKAAMVQMQSHLKQAGYRPDVTNDVTAIGKNDRAVREKMTESTHQLVRSLLIFSEHTDTIADGDRPTLIELPFNTVVPICLPGSKTEHLGYFVLIDEHGTPVQYDDNEVSPDKLMEMPGMQKAFVTMFGDGKKIFATARKREQWEVATSVFNIAVKHLLNKQLSSQNLRGLQFSQINAISNCIFSNILHKRKVRMVFVPAELMVYYRFDCRNDGTGKTLLEDIQTPLALRGILLVAKIMAMINSSISHKTVSFQVDEKDTNVEQTLALVQRMFMRKQMLDLNRISPESISEDLARRSVEIIPRGIPGLDGKMEIEKSSETRHHGEVNDDLFDTLTNMSIVAGLGLPASAINELSETEYSRSVATVNLMFCNIIRSRQAQLRKPNQKLVRNMVAMDRQLQKDILAIVVPNAQMDDEGDNVSADTANDILRAIIRSLTVILPAPNLSASKSQLEEVETFLRMIESIITAVFPTDLLPKDDRETEEVFTAVVANIKVNLIREFLSSISGNSLAIPELDEFLDRHTVDMTRAQQMLANLKKAIDARAIVIQPKEEEGSSGGGGGGYNY